MGKNGDYKDNQTYLGILEKLSKRWIVYKNKHLLSEKYQKIH